MPPAGEIPQIESIEILESLGEGGMSHVYKARQRHMDRLVAVKVLSALSENGIKRFQQEARLTCALNHPNIVKTFSFGLSQNGLPYLILEYLDGISLSDELKNHGRLSLEKFRDYFLPVLSALDQAHKSGIVHRDIKPGNMMICRDVDGKNTIKLVDFGIARIFGDEVSSTLTGSGILIGSPTYMSPEQCLGKPVDGRSDLYSLACVMYEALAGEPPFSGATSLEVMQKHCSCASPTVSELSRRIDVRKELAAMVLSGLAKDPNERPRTAGDYAAKLKAILEKITLDRVPKLKTKTSNLYRVYQILAPGVIIFLVIFAVFLFYKQYKLDQKQISYAKKSSKVENLSSFGSKGSLAFLLNEIREHVIAEQNCPRQLVLESIKALDDRILAISNLDQVTLLSAAMEKIILKERLGENIACNSELFERAEKLSLKDGKPSLETAAILLHRSRFASKFGNFSDAKVLADKAVDLYEQFQNDTPIKHSVLGAKTFQYADEKDTNLAGAYLQRGLLSQGAKKFDQAIDCYHKGAELKRGDLRSRWNFLSREVDLLCKTSRKGKAVKLVTEFQDETMSQKARNPEITLEVLKIVADWFVEQHRPEAAKLALDCRRKVVAEFGLSVNGTKAAGNNLTPKQRTR